MFISILDLFFAFWLSQRQDPLPYHLCWGSFRLTFSMVKRNHPKDPSQLTKYCSIRQKPSSNSIQGHLKYHFYQEKFPKSLIQDLHLKHIAKLVSLYHIQYTLISYLLYTRHPFKSLTNTNTFNSKLFNTIINPNLKTIELKFRDIKQFVQGHDANNWQAMWLQHLCP